MGLSLRTFNKIWSGADFWNTQENRRQRQAFARQAPPPAPVQQAPMFRQPGFSMFPPGPVFQNRFVQTPPPSFGRSPQFKIGNLNVNTAPLPQGHGPDPVGRFLKPVGDMGKASIQAVGQVVRTPYSIGRTIPASLTHNKVALRNANRAANKDVANVVALARSIPRQGVQFAESIPAPFLNPHPSRRNISPNNPILGKDPIPSIQRQFKDTSKREGGASAAGEAFATLAGDVLTGLGAKESLQKGVRVGVRTAPKIAEKAGPTLRKLNQPFGPVDKPPKISVPKSVPNDLKPAGLRQYKTANIRDIKPGDYASARLAPQQVTYPVKVIAGRFTHAMEKLQKKDPEVWSNFWRHVEKPPKNPSKELNQAMYWWREGANRVHAAANASGRQTAYLKDFALHPWKVAGLTDAEIAAGVRSDGTGILKSHAKQRKYRTIAQAEADPNFNLKLGDNPTVEGLSYMKGGANAVARLISKDALAKADAGQPVKPHTLDLGWGSTVQLSDKGLREARAYHNYAPSANKVIRGARTANVAAKSSILSYGQFHPFNVAALRAGPAIAFKGHPVRGAVGVGRTFRPLLPGGKGFVDRVLTKAYQDGMIDKAAELGMPYGEAGYNVAGTALKGGAGHRLVFERQMPMMHDQVVRAIVNDLEKRNIPLSSEEARQAGIVGNATMGFINKETLNLSPRLRQAMSDWMLAGQFTPSKIVTLSKVGKKGIAGKYARADVISNTISALTLVAGVGYLLKQNSDSARDIVLRALFDPAIPTPFKDKKGRNIEIGLPSTYSGEVSKLFGLTLERGSDGHLHPHFNPPQDMPGNVADWARARLSPIAGDALKIVTNTDFADKKLYDPNAPFGTKAAQAGTVLAQGKLPIGAQGIPYAGVVKDHLPGSVKDVLEANAPGTNPILKSSASSIGFRPRTDQTVGTALETATYFSAKDEARKQLKTDQARAAFDIYTGSKKNPVTHKYDVKPTVWDTISRAATLNQNPEALRALIDMNRKIAEKGGKVDPLWKESPSRIQAYFQNQANPDPFSPQRTVWFDKNKSWYQPLSDARGKFFDSLPKADPNKPAQPVEYPIPPKPIQKLKDQYYKITDGSKAFQFSKAHPELQNQLDKEFQYKNDLLKARGMTPYKSYPKAQPNVQKWIDNYVAASKPTRKGMRNADPKMYQNMSAYFDSVNLYNINKEGSKNQLQGQPDQTSKQNKAIKNLANDIYQNPDGSYSIVPAGWMSGRGGSGGSGGSGKASSRSSSRSSRSKKSTYSNPYKISVPAGRGRLTKPHVKIAAPKIKGAYKGGKPTVSMKVTKSKV